MTDEELYTLAGVEKTPSTEYLIWLVRKHQLIEFWKAASRQAEYQVRQFESAAKEKNT